MIELFNMDCLEYMASLPDKAFDLAIVDPPYGLKISNSKNIGFGTQYDTRNGKTILVTSQRRTWTIKDWDNSPPTDKYFKELVRVSKNQIIWGVNYFQYHFGSGRIVWDKVCSDELNDSAEEAYCSLNKGIKIFRFLWTGIMQGKNTNDGHIPQGNKSLYEERIHPTQKPIALYKWLLKNYAKPGDKILDTHGGSFSSAIACHQMGFDLTLTEIDKDYYEAGLKRYVEAIKQQTLFSYQ